MTTQKKMKWKYSIVVVNFPFSDKENSKERPALCLTEPTGRYHEVVLAYITSKIPYETLSTDIIVPKECEEFDATGLPHSFAVRLHKITTMSATLLPLAFGTLPQQLRENVDDQLRLLFSLR
ncbi:MAG: type II toxin-antitoxin system PemK/MazF family toxin [bacterium]